MIFDALVIGAGPAGATTALLLAQAGWSVAIVEKKNFPRRKVCGEFISATSLPLLQRLGIGDFYFTHGGPEVQRIGLFAAKTVLSANMPPAKYSLAKWGRALGREHLDTLLLDAAISAGVKHWQPAEINHLQQNAALSTCTITSNHTKHEMKARVVIIAHGSWERNDEWLETRAHKPADLLAFKAHFKNCALDDDLMPLLAFPGGYGGLVHTDNGRITLSCCIRRDALQLARQQYSPSSAGDAVLRHITTTCTGARDVFQNAEREGSWLAAGPIRPGIRKCYADGVFFVGNIAGEAHPIVAEGISMAMQSAWLLAEILIANRDDVVAGKEMTNAGREYTKHWRSHFATRIHVAALFAQFAMRPWAMELILPIFTRFPNLLSLGGKLSGKIKQVVPTLML